jgi:hypothetical protein
MSSDPTPFNTNFISVKEKATWGCVSVFFLKILTRTGMILLFPISQSTQILHQTAAHSDLVSKYFGM